MPHRMKLLTVIRRWQVLGHHPGRIMEARDYRATITSKPHPGDYSDSDTEEEAPLDVPAGCLAVYVGKERRRYVIDARYLNHKSFSGILQKSAEEFGYDHVGGLMLACEVLMFENLVWVLRKHVPAAW